jgi:hypothetical protein
MTGGKAQIGEYPGEGWKREWEMGNEREQEEGGRAGEGGSGGNWKQDVAVAVMKEEQGHQESNLIPSSRDNGATKPPDGQHPDTLSSRDESLVYYMICRSKY